MQFASDKKKIIKRFEALTKEELKLFHATYPNGFRKDVVTFTKSDGQVFHAVRMEGEETIYMVRVELPPIEEIDFGDEEDDFDDEEGGLIGDNMRFVPMNTMERGDDKEELIDTLEEEEEEEEDHADNYDI